MAGEMVEREFCRNCECDSCERQQQSNAIRATLAKDPQSRCWSCSCGWIACYTRRDVAKYGAPPECGKCYRERLVECDAPAS